MIGTLLHSPADVLGQMLVNLSYGTDPDDEAAWPVYVTREPDLPDNCITLFDTAGVIEGWSQLTGAAHERHGIQVRVRSGTPKVAWAKAREISVAFDEQTFNQTVTLDGTNYCVTIVNRTSEFSFEAEGPGKRRAVVVNALALIRTL